MQIATPPPFRPSRPPRPPEPPQKDLKNWPLEAAAGLSTYIAGTAFPTTYLHELGHATTARLLFQGANPTITVNPFKGGVTRFMPGPLTNLGEKVGRDGALAIVSAAGTAVDVGTSMLSFGVGYKIHKEHPYAGAALMGYGACTMLNSVLYAKSAVGLTAATAGGNDFANFALKTGLHPLASAAIIASLLPLEYLALRAIDKKD